MTFTIEGVGTCTYSLDFGDGNTEERTKRLPDRVTHVYPAVGDYTILVRAGSGLQRRVRAQSADSLSDI